MKQIFVRHGAYDEPSLELNAKGIEQTEAVAKYLVELLSGRKMSLLSCSGPRAMHSARLLRKELDSADITSGILSTDYSNYFNQKDIQEMPENSILVTNGKYMVAVSDYFSKLFKSETPMEDEPEKGTVSILICDFEVKNILRYDI